MYEAKCPTELRLCCKLFKESLLEINSNTPSKPPHEGTQAGNRDVLPNSEYTVGSLQDIVLEEGPSVDTRVQGEDPQGDTDRIPSFQLQQNADKSKTQNMVQSNILEKESQSSVLHSDLHKKDSPMTQEVLHHEAALQTTHHGAAMTKQQQYLKAVTNHDTHEVPKPHKKTTNKREHSEQSVNITERDNSEKEQSTFSVVDNAHHEMEEPSNSKYNNGISNHSLMVDDENFPLKGSHSLKHIQKTLKNGVRNSPETVIYHDNCLVTTTAEKIFENHDKSFDKAVGSSSKNGFLVQSDSSQNAPYKVKVSTVNNKLSNCKHDNNSFDPTPFKSYTFHRRARRRRNLKHQSVLADEHSLLHDEQINEVTLSWRTYANKYHPIEIHLGTDKQISPIYSSVLLEKGIMFSIFFWVYLVAFLYAVCYIMSSFVTPFSIFGITMKVLLVHYFPTIIQLEVFRAIDYIMTYIFKFT